MFHRFYYNLIDTSNILSEERLILEISLGQWGLSCRTKRRVKWLVFNSVGSTAVTAVGRLFVMLENHLSGSINGKQQWFPRPPHTRPSPHSAMNPIVHTTQRFSGLISMGSYALMSAEQRIIARVLCRISVISSVSKKFIRKMDGVPRIRLTAFRCLKCEITYLLCGVPNLCPYFIFSKGNESTF